MEPTSDLAALAATYRNDLLNDVIPFWLRFGLDREHGGVLTCLDRDGTVVDSDKGVWQQGRCAWMFARLYNTVERRPEWLEMALSCGQFLEKHGIDAADGKMWFHVTREGRPLRKRRYFFSESFAAIGWAELARATGEERYATLASEAFLRFAASAGTGGATVPKFAETRPQRSLSLPMIGIVTAQELRAAIDLENANAWIGGWIDEILQFHVNEEFQCLLESPGADGNLVDHFDGRLLNPGHALEAAWFIMREGHYRADPARVASACQILDWMWNHGWDRQHGGIRYFVDCRGLPVQEYWHDMKFWWPQCEAIIATLMAYLLTGEARYATWHRAIHDWAWSHFPDREHGEWFGYLHLDARISSSLKGNLWKGPFHIPRMMLECWNMLSSDAWAECRDQLS